MQARLHRMTGKRLGAIALVGALAAMVAVPVSAAIPDARHLTMWGEPGSADGQFEFVSGVALGPDGTVFVADSGNHRIQVFTAHGDHLATWGGPAAGDLPGQFSSPEGVSVAPDGTVYVADRGNHRIQHFATDGTPLNQWGSFGFADEEFNGPAGIAVDRDGRVYVADSGNNRIQVFTGGGGHIDTWGGLNEGIEPGEFDGPQDVTYGPDGRVYVADTFNERIQVFTPGGSHLLTITSPALSLPYSVDVTVDGMVLVASFHNDRIVVFDTDGGLLGHWGEAGQMPGEIANPAGVVAGRFGMLYVAENANNRVQQFALPNVTRLAGDNRFGTAADISHNHHPFFDVDPVFIATGSNFPDALAGAVAAAANLSPLLLTSSVPAETAAELARLDPTSIVIFGGESAVDAATADALGAFGAVSRVSGANRYLTAVEISEFTFPMDGSADTVVVATGENFPDALAAASLAAQMNGPVLLTPTASLHPAVAAEITRLDPASILVVGGPAAVSSEVFSDLAALAPTIRVEGADRYATAVEISKEAFPTGAGVVYLAVGTNFPDALTGAAQAAAAGSPVLLTPSSGLPADVAAEITRLDPYAVVILGGTAVVPTAIEDQVKALLGI